MGKWRCIWVGRREEGYVRQAEELYLKRMGRYRQLWCQQVRPSPWGERGLSEEGKRVEQLLGERDVLVLLDVGGREGSSEQLAGWLAEWEQEAGGYLCFLVGGAWGVHQRLRARAHYRLSLSRFTLPHGLARVVLLEQLYRALSWQHGHGYHHGGAPVM